MRLLRLGLGVLLLVSIVAVGVYSVFEKKYSDDKSVIPEPEIFIPSFSFPDESGKAIVLEDVGGDVRVVNFWASWSPYSRAELQALAALKREYGRRIAVVAINRDANSAEGRAFFESLAIDGDIVTVYDQQDTYYKTVGGYNMPETLFVNEDGGVLTHIHGPMTYEDMNSTLRALLAE